MVSSVIDFIGRTPIMKLKVTYGGYTYSPYVKLEFLNPSGSVKDRIVKYMVETAEERGILKPDSVIVEATSGNTGISLAMVAAAKGYRMVIFMPEHMSRERIRLMEAWARKFASLRRRTDLRGQFDEPRKWQQNQITSTSRISLAT